MNSSAIVAAVRDSAAKFPDKTALIAGDQQVSYWTRPTSEAW
jgi:acyl-CoA synthetase (AMP-forming)/AMP-acid ligase II